MFLKEDLKIYIKLFSLKKKTYKKGRNHPFAKFDKLSKKRENLSF